jgi:hypothetical protein
VPDAAQSDRPLAPAVALVLTAAAGVVAGLATLLQVTAGRSEGTEATLYLIAFGLLLPASLVAIRLLAAGRPRRLGGDEVAALACLAAAGLAAGLIASRALEGLAGVSAPEVQLALLIAWGAGMLLAAREPALARLRARLGRYPPQVIGWGPAALAPILAVAFASDSPPGAGPLLASLGIGAAMVGLYLWLDRRPPLPRWARRTIDVAVLALIVLLVCDVFVYTAGSTLEVDPELGSPPGPWLQNHQDPFLGPANDVLHGRTMLVDTYAQYGYGNVYALAGLFTVVPIGYGTFGLAVAAAWAALYALGYATLRLAGGAPLLAAAALGAVVVSSIFDPAGSPATFPANGTQRWWMAYLVVMLAVLAARRPQRTLQLRFAMAALVGLASAWSFEAFVYTAAAFVACVALDELVDGRAGRFWWRAGRALVPAALAVVLAQAALTLFTLARSGELPRWGPYLDFLSEYSTGRLNVVPAPDWWPGLLYAGFLFASLVALAAIVWERPTLARENRPALVAIAGLTAFGIADFSYIVRFSTNQTVLSHDLAALMIGALWLSLAARHGAAVPRGVRAAAAAFAFWLVGLLIVNGWNELIRKGDRTPLAQAISTQGGWLDSDLSRTWSNPPLDHRVLEAERLLERYWPDQKEALVLIHPEASVEALMRADRINTLPVSDFLVDDVVIEQTADRVLPVLDRLRPGTLLLTERFYLTPGARRDYIVRDAPALPLERLVLSRLRRRFSLEPVLETPQGLVLVRLTPRR